MRDLKIILSIAAAVSLSGCSRNASREATGENGKPQVAVSKAAATVIGEQPEPDTLKGSLDALAVGKIGDAEIRISYHSPAVRGRIVWGGLVPYDKVWVTGAHMATSLEFDKPLEIGGKLIPPGKYGFFTIPGEQDWVMIVNKNWQQHLVDEYDAAEDVVRVKVKPELESNRQERLRYVVEAESETSGELVVYWDKLEVSLPVKVKP